MEWRVLRSIFADSLLTLAHARQDNRTAERPRCNSACVMKLKTESIQLPFANIYSCSMRVLLMAPKWTHIIIVRSLVRSIARWERRLERFAQHLTVIRQIECDAVCNVKHAKGEQSVISLWSSIVGRRKITKETIVTRSIHLHKNCRTMSQQRFVHLSRFSRTFRIMVQRKALDSPKSQKMII